MSEQQQLPPGATPVTEDDLLAAIGELYVQVRMFRRVIFAQQQQQASTSATSANGTLNDAVHLEL